MSLLVCFTIRVRVSSRMLPLETCSASCFATLFAAATSAAVAALESEADEDIWQGNTQEKEIEKKQRGQCKREVVQPERRAAVTARLSASQSVSQLSHVCVEVHFVCKFLCQIGCGLK